MIKINRSNNPRQMDGVEYYSCRRTSGVESGEVGSTNCPDLGNKFKTIKREKRILVSGIIYMENNVFIFENSFSQDLTSTLS